MGFHSYTCARTHLPIMGSNSWEGSPAMSKVVVLFKDLPKKRLEGLYDGYGRVDGKVIEALDVKLGWIKLVLAEFYEGESFGQLGPSGEEIGHGHFLPRAWVEQAYVDGGWSTYEGYREAAVAAGEEYFGQLG